MLKIHLQFNNLVYLAKTLFSALLTSPTLGSGQQVLSHIPVGKSGPTGGITTTLTHQQLLQLPPQFQAQLQVWKTGF